MIIEITDADILFNTPMISNIPGITSANAMIMANSPGIPIDDIQPTNPSLPNLLNPCMMKITPIANLNPRNTVSFKIFSLISLVVNLFNLFFHYSHKKDMVCSIFVLHNFVIS